MTSPLDRGLLRAAGRWALRRSGGGAPAFPYVRQRRQPVFQVLVYHRVSDEPARYFPGVPVRRFREQMEALARFTTVLGLGDLVARMATGDVPPASIAITFDDGYRDNYEHAFPILRDLGLPATIFLATGPLETGAPLWHDRVFDAFEHARCPSLQVAGRALDMGTPVAAGAALRELLGLLRRQTPEERERTVASVEAQTGAPAPADARSRMLTWEQAEEMARHRIAFGAHTVSHPTLTRLPLDRAEEEIRASRNSIERRLGRPVDLFAYPTGTAEDFNPAIQQILRAEGFRCAVTTLWGSNSASTDPMELRRIGFWTTSARWIPLRLAWYRFDS